MDDLASAAQQCASLSVIPPDYVKNYLRTLMGHTPNPARFWKYTRLPDNNHVLGLFNCMLKGHVNSSKGWLKDHGCIDEERALLKGNMSALFDILHVERTHRCKDAEDKPAPKRPRASEPAPPERSSAKNASLKIANQVADEEMEMEDRLGVLANDVELLKEAMPEDALAAIDAAVESTQAFEKSAADISAASLAAMQADNAHTDQARETILCWHSLLDVLRAEIVKLRAERAPLDEQITKAKAHAEDLERQLKVARDKIAADAGTVPALRSENGFLKSEKKNLEETNARLFAEVNRLDERCKALEAKSELRKEVILATWEQKKAQEEKELLQRDFNRRKLELESAEQAAAQKLRRVSLPLTPTVSESPADQK